MMAEQISLILEELRQATHQLFLTSNRFDLDRMETAVALRETAVIKLNRLIAQHPDAFTHEHLEIVRDCHSSGKQALQNLIAIRKTGWVTATELSSTEHILKTFARIGSFPDKSQEGVI
jgi:hypothetical protein